MTSAVSDVPEFPSFDYFDRPPAWARNLVAVTAAVLAFFGSVGLLGRSGDAAHATHTAHTAPAAAPAINADSSPPAGAAPNRPATTDAGYFANDIFTARFPAEPQTSTQTKTVDGQSLELTMHLVDGGDIAYMLATTPLPASAGFDFRAGAEGAARNAGGTVEIARRTTFSSYPAMDVKAKVAVGTMRVMIVRTPRHMVQVMVFGVDDPAKQYQDFIDSVTIR